MPVVSDKHVSFEALAAGYDDAYRRAERLARDADDRGDDVIGNPSTEVYSLTDSIDEEGVRRRTRPTAQGDDSRAEARAAAESAARQAEEELRVLANDGLESDELSSFLDEDPDT